MPIPPLDSLLGLSSLLAFQDVLLLMVESPNGDLDLAAASGAVASAPPMPVRVLSQPPVLDPRGSTARSAVVCLTSYGCEFAMKGRRLDSDFVWVVHNSSSNVREGGNLRLDSRVVLFFQKGDTFFFDELYSLGKGNAAVRSSPLGRWSSEEGFDSDTHSYIWTRRSDLTGMTLRYATLAWKGLIETKTASDGKAATSQGMFRDILEDLRAMLGFSVETIIPEDKQWGIQVGLPGTSDEQAVS